MEAIRCHKYGIFAHKGAMSNTDASLDIEISTKVLYGIHMRPQYVIIMWRMLYSCSVYICKYRNVYMYIYIYIYIYICTYTGVYIYIYMYIVLNWHGQIPVHNCEMRFTHKTWYQGAISPLSHHSESKQHLGQQCMGHFPKKMPCLVVPKCKLNLRRQGVQLHMCCGAASEESFLLSWCCISILFHFLSILLRQIALRYVPFIFISCNLYSCSILHLEVNWQSGGNFPVQMVMCECH
jgi:hypothetical protein